MYLAVNSAAFLSCCTEIHHFAKQAAHKMKGVCDSKVMFISSGYNLTSWYSSSTVWKGPMFSTHIWSHICKGLVSTSSCGQLTYLSLSKTLPSRHRAVGLLLHDLSYVFETLQCFGHWYMEVNATIFIVIIITAIAARKFWTWLPAVSLELMQDKF